VGIPTFVNQDSAVEWQVGLTSGNIKRARRMAPSYSVSTGLFDGMRVMRVRLSFDTGGMARSIRKKND